MSDRGEPQTRPGADRFGRTQLSVEQFARKLDHRLPYPHLRRDDLEDGCRFALEHGLAAVICRADQVPEVAQLVAGAGIGLATALDFYEDTPTGRPKRGASLTKGPPSWPWWRPPPSSQPPTGTRTWSACAVCWLWATAAGSGCGSTST